MNVPTNIVQSDAQRRTEQANRQAFIKKATAECNEKYPTDGPKTSALDFNALCISSRTRD